MSSVSRRPLPASQRPTPVDHAVPQLNGQYQRVALEDEADHALSDVSPNTAGGVSERHRLHAMATTDPSQVSSSESTTQNIGAPEQKVEPELPSHNTRFERFSHKYDRVTSDHWTYELVGVFVSVATLVSIIGILLAYQGGPTPHIMRGVSLNTAISALATVSRAAVVYVAASVIAQQKWLRYELKPRSLYDVLLYDDATRGPLGSFLLLGSMRLGLITVLAACVAVLALGFEPFVQQSLRYPLKDTPLSTGSPVILSVQNVSLANQPGQNRTLLLGNAVSQALYSDSIIPLQPSCGGSSCDWPLYHSVAFCSSCEDAMDDLIIEPKRDAALQAYLNNDYLSTYRFSDLNLSMNLGNTMMYVIHSANTTYNLSLGVGAPTQFTLSSSANLALIDQVNTSSLSYPETVVWDLNDMSKEQCSYTDTDGSSCFYYPNTTINNIPGPLKAFGYVKMTPAADRSRLVALEAQRCVITLCAQQLSSTVVNGSLSSRVEDTNFGYYVAQGQPLQNPEAADDGSTPATLTWFASQNGSSFQAGPTYGADHSILFDYLIVLNALQGTLTRWYSTGDPFFYEGQPGTGTFNPVPNVLQFMSDVRNNTAKLAQSLSNLMQQDSSIPIKGQVYQSIPFVEVRWAWLAFPISLLVIVLAALIATMLQTRQRRVPLWKSSPYPLLFNYHDQDRCNVPDGAVGAAVVSQAVTTSRHEEMAKERLLRLRSTGGSWIFEKNS